MNLFTRKARRAHSQGRKQNPVRPSIELFEARLLLTAFVVTDNSDTDTGTATSGTLRHVINQLDATGGATNTITFNIGDGLQTITLGSNLQAITKPVSIDGYSQPGGTKVNDAIIGTNAIILIQVNLNGHLGLVLSTGADANGGSSVKGLSIFGGSDAAIGVNTNNVSVTGNFLGVQADGTTIAANAIGASVVAAATAGVQIGTPALADRNLISGNTGSGVNIAGTAQVQGNLIGTDRAGLLAKANNVGVALSGSGSSVGGAGPNAGNVISGNTSQGVSLGGASSIVIQANLIGLKADGSAALSNGGDGILLDTASSTNTIGLATDGTGVGNTISGNIGFGVNLVAGAGDSTNLIAGNLVGLDSANHLRPNNAGGIAVDGLNNTVGGTAPAARNVVSGNNNTGLTVGSTTLVEGNFIGTNLAGAALPGSTQTDGMLIGSNNTIGGTTSGTGNLIAGNTQSGVHLLGSTNLIERNTIGLSASGTVLPNNTGILFGSGATGNTIGGATTAGSNTIGGNTTAGVSISNSGATGNLVRNNFIGTNSAGANLDDIIGILINTANNSVTGNTIGFNTTAGVQIIGINATGNILISNFIGTDGTGAALGNGTGVVVSSAANFIGQTGNGNTIGRNTVAGVSVSGASATGNQVVANFIGTNAAGANLDNQLGVVIDQGAATTTLDSNKIGFNTTAGVKITGVAGTGNILISNFIGTDGTGAALGNGTGVVVSSAANFIGQTGNGNTIGQNAIAGVSISGASATGNQVVANFIGTNASGADLDNQLGVVIDQASATNTLSSNTIGSNTTAGVQITSQAGSGNVLVGNFIGTDSTGAALGNGTGVEVSSASNFIGQPGTGNTIGANTNAGVQIDGNGTGNFVQQNLIGTNAANADLQNGLGVVIFTSGNTIGDSTGGSGAGNTIGFNQQVGVYVAFGVQNIIRGNLYLGANGPTINVPASDIFLGPSSNNGQNAPILLSSTLVGNQLTVQFTVSAPLGTPAGSQVVVDFYQDNPTASPAERSFLATTTVPLGAGTQTFTFTAPAGFKTSLSVIGTETIAANGTSAFSSASLVADQFTVTNTNDDGDGSLRAAIIAANSTNEVTPCIRFHIPLDQSINGSGFYQITIASALPAITHKVNIDGSSQPEFLTYLNRDTTQIPSPVIQIYGGFAIDDGLRLDHGSDGSTISALNISGFQNGIHLVDTSNVTLAANWIGDTAQLPFTPKFDLGNLSYFVYEGVLVENSTGITVGTSTIATGDLNCVPYTSLPSINGRNLFASTQDGIVIAGGHSNTVQNNFLGTDYFGSLITDQQTGFDLYNTRDGIILANTSDNSIGGALGSATNNSTFNLVSGNFGNGIEIFGTSASPNKIFNNYIGTDSSGSASSQFQGNLGDGVLVHPGLGISLSDGGTGYTSAPSVILDGGGGMDAEATATIRGPVSSLTLTSGGGGYTQPPIVSLVGGGGTGATATATINASGQVTGLVLSNGGSNYSSAPLVVFTNAVGDTTGAGASATATISGSVTGLSVTFPGTGYTTPFAVQFVGGGGSGARAIASVSSPDGSDLGVVGQGRNIISGNYGNGIEVDNTNNVVLSNNFIGTDKSGLFSSDTLGNALNGIYLNATAGNLVVQNLISGNLKAGLRIEGGAGRNQVVGNLVGTTSTGNSDIPNGTNGIEIVNSGGNIVGGTLDSSGMITSYQQNVITGNNGNGVLISGPHPGQGNTIMGNVIGAKTASSQTAGNAFDGISLVDTSGNTIGGSTPLARNIITSNGFGSFARPQLSIAPRTNPNNPGSIYSYSYSSIAVGDVGDTSYQAVTSLVSFQFRDPNTGQIISSPLDEELLLYRTDATGLATSNLSEPPFAVSLTSLGLPSLPAGDAWRFSLLSGRFNVSSRDDLLLTAYLVDQTTGNPVPVASGQSTWGVLLSTMLNAMGNPVIDTSNPQTIPLNNLPLVSPTPVITSVGHFLPGTDLQQFLVASQLASGQAQITIYDPAKLNDPTYTPTTIKLDQGIVVNDAITASVFSTALDDIAVAETGQDQGTPIDRVVVFKNTTTGGQPSFGSGIATDLSTYSYGGQPLTPALLATGAFDLKNPSTTDLVVVDHRSSGAFAVVLQGQGDGSFRPFPGQVTPTSYPVGTNPSRVAVDFLEEPGVQDVAILNNGNSSTPGTVTLLSSNGDGTFRTPTNYDVGANPTDMTMVTIGGIPQLAISNAASQNTASNPAQLQVNSRLLSARRSDGISVTGNSQSNAIQGNFVGLDVQGNQARPNATDGILIDATGASRSQGNIIGGSAVGTGNVISGNDADGIHLLVGSLGASPLDLIQGNIIGLDSTGQTGIDSLGRPLGNSKHGVELDGLAALIEQNTISANGINGIDINPRLGVLVAKATSPSDVTVPAEITGNLIGTNITGVNAYSTDGAPLGNVLNGISLNDVLGVSIGGSTTASQNIIAGNLGRGIQVRGDLLPVGIQPQDHSNSILANLIGLGAGGSAVQTVGGKPLSLGNLSEGIFLVGAIGTFIGAVDISTNIPLSVISNNLGYGIHAIDSGYVTVEGNLIGIYVSETGVPKVSAFGNGSDGIFLEQTPNATIGGAANAARNVISANRGSGIHVAQATNITIVNNLIGTDNAGAITSTFGNGSDGVFLDRVNLSVGEASAAAISDNVISGNRSNGIDLIDSDHVSIVRNKVGSNASGTAVKPGNAGSGVFLNSSSNITIGGAVADGNILSGNQVYGVAISALTGGSASSNVVSGNRIGLDVNDATLANGVSGILLNNATLNTIGGSVAGSGNTISGNQLYGVQINTGSDGNMIWGNFIGTGSHGVAARGNNSDGVFLNSARNNQIGGPLPTEENIISGNAGNGIQIFASASTGNTVANNLIGLQSDGLTPAANAGSGVFLNAAGPNTIGGITPQARNIISGNQQAGVLILSYVGAGGSTVEGNYIGTTFDGTNAAANRGPGVYINGSSQNTIGGMTPGAGNLISGNAQSGITIFSPPGSAISQFNVVAGNLIGTKGNGTEALPNGGNGVDILGGQSNTIGQPNGWNVISGNSSSGVYITTLSPELQATSNVIANNYIGTDQTGSKALTSSLQQFGVLVSNAWGNTIGATGGATIANTNVPATARNVISGNLQAGIDLTASATGNSVEGNYIGVNSSGFIDLAPANLGNTTGVLVDNSAGNIIGGSVQGAGNIISQSAVSSAGASLTGILIQGPPAVPDLNTLVQGNLIGLDKNYQPAANEFGVRIVNSANNVIGFMPGSVGSADLTSSDVGARNIISGNSIAGVQITGRASTGNRVAGNYIGTDPAGMQLIQAAGANDYQEFAMMINDRSDPKTHVVVPTQQTGVLIDQGSSNLIGSSAAGSGNLISGNEIGVDIEGAAGDISKGAFNVVQNNLIGTDLTGMNALPNFEYGVNINGSPKNVIASNVISANGVAGVLIFGGAGKNTTAVPLGNSIISNKIGTNSTGGVSFAASAAVDMNQHPQILNPSTDGDPKHFLPAYLGFQLHGVVIIGSAGNNIGPGSKAGPAAQKNLISGNILTGIYLTSHDFIGNTFAQPFGNPIQFNTITRNGMYGAYRFDAPAGSNPVVVRGKGKNAISGNPLSIGDFVTGFSDKATVQANPQSLLLPGGFGVPVNPFVPTAGVGSGPKRGKGRKGGKGVRVKVVHATPKPNRNVVARSANSTGHNTAQSVVAHSVNGLTRTRVPALIRPGANLIRVDHPAIRPGK